MNKKTMVIIGLLVLTILIFMASNSGKKENGVKKLDNSKPTEKVKTVVKEVSDDESKNKVDTDTEKTKKTGEKKETEKTKTNYKSTDADKVQEKKASEMTSAEIAKKKSDYIDQIATITEDMANGRLPRGDAKIQIADLQKRVNALVDATK